MRKIVFAGGTHCGKTTLVEYFAKEGQATVSESGIHAISKFVDVMGWGGYRSWRLAHQEEFVEKMLEEQIRFEAKASQDAPYVFYDRGIIDYFAMADHLSVSFHSKFDAYAREYRYDLVFLCEPLAHFDQREQSGRMFTREDSKKLTIRAESLYREFGYVPIRLPDIPVPARVAIILKTIEEFFPAEPLRLSVPLPG